MMKEELLDSARFDKDDDVHELEFVAVVMGGWSRRCPGLCGISMNGGGDIHGYGKENG
jgi:hypothetical protein